MNPLSFLLVCFGGWMNRRQQACTTKKTRPNREIGLLRRLPVAVVENAADFLLALSDAIPLSKK